MLPLATYCHIHYHFHPFHFRSGTRPLFRFFWRGLGTRPIRIREVLRYIITVLLLRVDGVHVGRSIKTTRWTMQWNNLSKLEHACKSHFDSPPAVVISLLYLSHRANRPNIWLLSNIQQVCACKIMILCHVMVYYAYARSPKMIMLTKKHPSW